MTATTALAAVAAALLGAAMGSCLDALAARWPSLDRNFLVGRSRCESCATTLGATELIPLWSWLRQGGRCRHCGAAIGPLPLLAELVAAGTAALAFATLAPIPAGLLTLVGWWLLLLALIDIRHGRLPDLLTLPLILLGIAVAWAAWAPSRLDMPPGLAGPLPGPGASALGAALGYGLLAVVARGYRWWRGREGLGMGDAKLMAALGAWLGPAGLAPTLLIAAALGLAVALAQGLRRAEDAIAFGPWLATAGALLLWWRLWTGG